MKTNNYNIEHIIDALYSKGSTNFLTQHELMLIKNKLQKNEFKIYDLFEDSTKVILYKKNIPDIRLFKIITTGSIRHQDIMGIIFSLGLKEDTFGDIINYQGTFYIFLLPHLVDYFKYNLTNIKNNKVELEEVDIALSKNFKQNYIEQEYIVSSLRIDNVISTIINISRNSVLDKFKNKEVILNYEEEIKPTRTLKEEDVFSIRKYGKYKYKCILKETKKGGYIILVWHYI